MCMTHASFVLTGNLTTAVFLLHYIYTQSKLIVCVCTPPISFHLMPRQQSILVIFFSLIFLYRYIIEKLGGAWVWGYIYVHVQCIILDDTVAQLHDIAFHKKFCLFFQVVCVGVGDLLNIGKVGWSPQSSRGGSLIGSHPGSTQTGKTYHATF